MKIALAVATAIVVASPVPDSVQRAIPKKVPARLRYVPTQVPSGYRYAKWHGKRSGLEIDFARKGRPPMLAFITLASGDPGTCEASGTHTYRFGSVRVAFDRDRYIEQFWRCARANTVSIAATIRRTDVVTAAKRRAIAAMVASAARLG
ncbi:MAG: hypothetical protein ACTHQQ_17800 [Solirubrobacteraceae bacterium]